ncbi:transglycosylase SLT domain-containing protein [Caulobacter sp. SLTY]|uniref:transglycosylase SLT domain-containing protein n=1 Tax=Caulobacter sp. SLTY TaxID=2683262 RepID=UPI001411B509|nr:transglycosylase SLT domain-containing protein [Caulobacter sp. SLTY]NBB16247.1 transglycosylase SLT domain-containing protein [Caulobacter sp. SLTY]
MAVESIRGVVEQAIKRASDATGVDFSFLLGTAKRESGLKPHAKAQTSSAAGLFQFVEQTWLSTLKKHGSKYGYARYADLIVQGSDGRYRVNGAEARAAVMNLRYDPRAASLMAGELTSDHADYLRGRIGRPATAGELYAAHFLGPKGSAKLIEATRTQPHVSAAALFPDAAAANRPLFYKAGRPVSVAELYGNLTSTGGKATALRERMPQQDQGFLQYAGRRGDRQAQEDALVALILRGSQGFDGGGGGNSSNLAGSVFSAEMLRVLADSRRD